MALEVPAYARCTFLTLGTFRVKWEDWYNAQNLDPIKIYSSYLKKNFQYGEYVAEYKENSVWLLCIMESNVIRFATVDMYP